MMTYDEMDVAGAAGSAADREALLSELVAAIHHRIVRHYRLIRVLSDRARVLPGRGREAGLVERLAARAAEAEDIAMLVLEWMKDPDALERRRHGVAEGGGDGD
jgi:hypothetical protein